MLQKQVEFNLLRERKLMIKRHIEYTNISSMKKEEIGNMFKEMGEILTRKCSVCGMLFESEGLLSCPAHSFGDFKCVRCNGNGCPACEPQDKTL